MNWKLILQLSVFGLAMALGTVFFIPSSIEWVFWLAIFVLTAYLIARRAPGRPFLHGFMLALANCVWVTSAHVLLFSQYMATHASEAASMSAMPLAVAAHPRMMMAAIGPIVGVISGLVLGLFAWVASKFVASTAHRH